MAKLLVLHGPNLNLLGQREAEHYGTLTLDALNAQIQESADSLGHSLTVAQSNAEYVLIDHIQNAPQAGINFILINPAGLTHSSVALRDALLAVKLPFIEVHVSNIYAREPFRKQSYFSDIAEGVITGLGPKGYLFALQAAHQLLLDT